MLVLAVCVTARSMDRQSAIQSLEVHHTAVAYKPEERYENVASADGEYLGPYVPYIGARYLDSVPRVLIYAMAQNLAGEKGQSLIGGWYHNRDKGLRRQYYRESDMHVSVRPYDDGHLKVIAALALSSFPGTNYVSSQSVHERIVVTNFVEFSFIARGTNRRLLDANPPKGIYDDMWRNFSAYEVDLLQPDIVIGVGKDVAEAIRRNLRSEILVEIPFPGRLNLNSRFVPRGKRALENGFDRRGEIAKLADLLQGTPDSDGKIAGVIKTDWYYFAEMRDRFNTFMARS